MKQIRYGVFETNSSSVHTIAIPCERLDSDVYIPDKVKLEDNSYGWGFSVMDDFTDKVDYMYMVAKAYNDMKEEVARVLSDPKYEDSWYRKRCARLSFKYDDYVERYFEILHELGVSDIEINPVEDEYYYDINHGDMWVGELDEFFDDSELMKQFLFNDKSYIVTSNDNDDYFDENIHVSQTHPYPVDTYHKGN